MAAAICLTGMAQTPRYGNIKKCSNKKISILNKDNKATKDVNPVWHQISTDVMGANFLVPGQIISTAAIRNQGKAMVIDYSATWCYWCWIMHSNGILEAIQHQLGNDVQCIWVEADPTTDAAEITGGGNDTQGNWTQTAGGETVPYPIIDNPDFTDIIGGNSMIDGYPYVVFISPNGYWCDVYTFEPTDSTDAVSVITNALNNYPRPGVAPISVNISAPSVAFIGNQTTLSVDYISVDEVTSITWTLDGCDPATATGANVSATFITPGTHTISVTVTNTSGSTTATTTINIHDNWNWGDEMDYTDGEEYYSSIGIDGDGDITWGVRYPANLMGGRNYLAKISTLVYLSGDFDLRIYQGDVGDNPQTLIYENTYNLVGEDEWVDINIYDPIQLDTTKSLWVVFHCNGTYYPASYCAYTGDPNSHLIYDDETNRFVEVSELDDYFDNITWLIKTTTSATIPDFNFEIKGTPYGKTGDELTFKAYGPQGATYNWTLQGATPATATGTTVTTSWAEEGEYTITVEGSLNGESTTKSIQVNIISCGEKNGSNWHESFEYGIDCWTTIDADGDGYNWVSSKDEGFNVSHDGSCSMLSASFINFVGAITPDNWAISPKINLPSESASLEWWSGGVYFLYYNEYYSVLVSTTDNDTASFTHLIYSGENESEEFTRHTFSLDQFAGQSIYIAFRHHNSTELYWLAIDDVTVSGTGHVGIDALNTANVDFYPNPVDDKLYISEEVANVNVTDINGRTVITANDTRVVDMSKLSNGVYFVRVVSDKGTAIKKVVKR